VHPSLWNVLKKTSRFSNDREKSAIGKIREWARIIFHHSFRNDCFVLMSGDERYSLGTTRLDPASGMVSGPNGQVQLEPRVAELAVCLARRPGQVVSRNELIDAVWNGYPGADQSLTNAASKLRQALEAAGDSRATVETVPKRGYRLGVPVQPDESDGRRGRSRLVPALAGLSLLLVLVFTLPHIFESSNDSDIGNSIAVLAFEDLSPGGDHGYLSRGIAEEVLNLLAQVPDLRVVGRTSAFSFAGKDITISEIGEQLGVSHILEGSLRRQGDRLRITVQLLDAESDRHLWSETYQMRYDDIFAVQDRIATSVAEQMQLRLVGQAPTTPKTDYRTHALYLRARFLFDRGSTEAAEQAGQLLVQALTRDPDHVPSLRLLARHAFTMGKLDLARSTVERIHSLDPGDGIAHVFRAWVAFRSRRNPEAALESVETALLNAPNDPEVLRLSGRLLRAMGLFDEATAVLERAVQFDPLCARCVYSLAHAYLYNGDLDAAEVRIRRYVQIAEGGWITLGNILLLKGDPEAALAAYDNQKPPAGHEAWWLSGRAMAFADLGCSGEFKRTLDRLIETWEGRQPIALARVFAWTGETDRAFEWLAREPDIDDLVGNPYFHKIRGDPRWRALLEAQGLIPIPRMVIDLELENH